jgi:hypothetical protein
VFKNSKVAVLDFLSLNRNLVLSCFTKNQSSRKAISYGRLLSIFFRLKKKSFEIFCLVYLLFTEPTVVIAQFALRRNGGLKGSYQFHRLFEIRRFIKLNKVSTAIEFGSGASTILFKKYMKDFFSIEESHEWATNYIEALENSKMFSKSYLAELRTTIMVLPRIEFLDAAGELVCSYELPDEITNRKFELAYIDGPTSWIQSEHFFDAKIRDQHKSIPNTSALELSFMPQYLLIDGRRATVSYFIEKRSMQSSSLVLKGSFNKSSLVRPYHTIIYNK